MYVDAYYHKDSDTIRIVERVKGERVFRDLPANHTLYYPDARGKYTSIYGDKLTKFSTHSHRLFQKERAKRSGTRLFESDINPVFRCLSEHYRNCETPELQVGFFDIEVGFDQKRGFAPAADPFNEITAISVYLQWQKRLVTLALCPPTLMPRHAAEIASEFENTTLFVNESDLLAEFFAVIDDCDVISGWNSTGFDIPYLVNRVRRLSGDRNVDEAAKLCLWDQTPRKREYTKFKKTFSTFDLVGRVHLDYLELYQKHNTQQLHSYRLDFVAELEVGENKTVYEGTLDQLYKQDFRKFIEYNRQDVMLLGKIDAKRKFIELSNQVAHTNTVLLKTTVGSVALVEQAIINEMHDRGLIAPDRRAEEAETILVESEDDDDDEPTEAAVPAEHTPVVGAYVADPKKGLHEQVSAVDINSLYPSTIRALNMSPETIVAQLRPVRTQALIAERLATLKKNERAQAWEAIFATVEYDLVLNRSPETLLVDFETDGSCAEFSGAELYEWVFGAGSNVCITANGTIFRTDVEGIIPGLLARWYNERQQMQAKKSEYKKLADKESDPAKRGEHKALEMFWDQRQLARKILLNSLYGALLNESMRFYDQRIGQSVTLTGRSVARHMNSEINRTITGVYDHKGDAIIYADTDSSYFSAKPFLAEAATMTREEFIAHYNKIGEAVNATFAQFMDSHFNTGLERGAIIKAARELVASNALFIKKKKYACLLYDKEGQRQDVNGKAGTLKTMGLDLKRADTPKFMQQFLEKVLLDTLTGTAKSDIFAAIKAFRSDFTSRPGWEKGTPKKVNALTDHSGKEAKLAAMGIAEIRQLKRDEKVAVSMPGHVRAAMNWNILREMHDDRYAMEIGDGAKVIVCKLRKNPLCIRGKEVTSVAYPIDEPHLPEWFKQLPFDHDAMETTIIDDKLKNLLGVLDWDLEQTKESVIDDLFTFARKHD